MKIKVDEDECISCETCVEICPEVFEMEGDIAVARMEDIPEALQEACREAADSCAVEAIIIEE